MKKQKEELKELTSPFWMTTYGDMVTLLLVFFILILSYSTIELEKFKGAMSSMKGALGILPSPGSAQKKHNVNFRQKMTARQTDIADRVDKFKEDVSKTNFEEMVDVEMDASGIHIRLGDKVLFDIGKARIKPEAFTILSSIARVVKNDYKEIYVEGHTDDIPIKTKKYPTNWELSTARALSVVRYLHDVEGISAKNLAAVGHGEYRPLAPNTSAKKRAKNRRVEIFIKWE